MNPNKLERLFRLKLFENSELECLIGRASSEDSSPEGAQAPGPGTDQIGQDNSVPFVALSYYRGMRLALDFNDVRWLGLEIPTLDTRQLRRDCAEQYRRYRMLFELEVAIGRKQKAAGMALAQNWSGMASVLRDDIAAYRCRLMLLTAELMFRSGLPGALDLCDSAVCGIVRLIYLRPAA